MMEQLPDHNGAKVCDEGNIFFSEKIVIKKTKKLSKIQCSIVLRHPEKEVTWL
jgi:hypothetical protein